jgi:hypothetical protein
MKSDFSGEYELNLSASTLSDVVADGVKRGTVRIDHQEPQFRCRLAYIFTDGKTFDAAFELVTDGREIANTDHGQTSVSTLHWDGEALVFSSRAEGGLALTFRYELLDAGRRLRMAEGLRGTDHDHDNVWILDRQ